MQIFKYVFMTLSTLGLFAKAIAVTPSFQDSSTIVPATATQAAIHPQTYTIFTSAPFKISGISNKAKQVTVNIPLTKINYRTNRKNDLCNHTGEAAYHLEATVNTLGFGTNTEYRYHDNPVTNCALGDFKFFAGTPVNDGAEVNIKIGVHDQLSDSYIENDGTISNLTRTLYQLNRKHNYCTDALKQHGVSVLVNLQLQCVPNE